VLHHTPSHGVIYQQLREIDAHFYRCTVHRSPPPLPE
jgi:hypothetical protein